MAELSLGDDNPIDQVQGFFAVDKIDATLALLGYGVEEELRTLVDIVRNSEEASARIRATKEIRAVVRESAKMSGRIVEHSQEKRHGGESEVRQRIRGSSFIGRLNPTNGSRSGSERDPNRHTRLGAVDRNEPA